MGKTASSKDAELILKLYELRREPELRKARNWWLWEFSPSTAEDFLKVANAAGSPENNWLRQGASYWGMAAAFVRQGLLDEDLFLRPACSGEMFFILAKVYPFLPELREKLGDPEVFRDVEKVATNSKWGRERLQFVIKRIEMMREKKAREAKG
jgi:hypothetical protein